MSTRKPRSQVIFEDPDFASWKNLVAADIVASNPPDVANLPNATDDTTDEYGRLRNVDWISVNGYDLTTLNVTITGGTSVTFQVKFWLYDTVNSKSISDGVYANTAGENLQIPICPNGSLYLGMTLQALGGGGTPALNVNYRRRNPTAVGGC